MLLLKSAAVDYKWRLTIPSAVVDRESLMEEDEVFLTTGDDGCLEIYFTKPSDLDSSSGMPIIQVKTAQNKKDGQTRLVIPDFLRNATSFFYGRSVVVADFGKKIELWPRLEGGKSGRQRQG